MARKWVQYSDDEKRVILENSSNKKVAKILKRKVSSIYNMRYRMNDGSAPLPKLQKGKTMQELGNELGVNKSTISRWASKKKKSNAESIVKAITLSRNVLNKINKVRVYNDKIVLVY